MGPEFLVSETVDPYLFTALAVVSGLWLFNKLLSTNPKMVAEGKPYGVLDSDGLLWAATNVKNLKTTPLPGVKTVYDLVQHGINANGPRDALGKRPLLERHYEDLNGKKVEKLTYADHYEWMSYTQFGKAISSLGAGLVRLANLKPQDRVIIYAETQREWMLVAQAAFSQSLQVVTVYATLGEEGLIHGTTQTKSKVIVADAKLLKIVANAIKTNKVEENANPNPSPNPHPQIPTPTPTPTLTLTLTLTLPQTLTLTLTLTLPVNKAGMKSCTAVVYIADPVQKPDPVAAAAIDAALEALEKAGVEVVTFDALQASGEAKPLPAAPPKAEDVAVIMYTSGTTGLPKGVMISHANIVAGSAGLLDRTAGAHITMESGANETYCAYLPLAHIMEMICETGLYALGARVGFGSPHTLTPTGVKLKTGTCEGDAAVLGPTMMVFAPAVLDKVYAGLNAKIKAASPAVQKLFAAGMAAGEANFAKGIIGAPWYYNKIVFKKVQALLGGKLKFAGTGSA